MDAIDALGMGRLSRHGWATVQHTSGVRGDVWYASRCLPNSLEVHLKIETHTEKRRLRSRDEGKRPATA